MSFFYHWLCLVSRLYSLKTKEPFFFLAREIIQTLASDVATVYLLSFPPFESHPLQNSSPSPFLSLHSYSGSIFPHKARERVLIMNRSNEKYAGSGYLTQASVGWKPRFSFNPIKTPPNFSISGIFRSFIRQIDKLPPSDFKFVFLTMLPIFTTKHSLFVLLIVIPVG